MNNFLWGGRELSKGQRDNIMQMSRSKFGKRALYQDLSKSPSIRKDKNMLHHAVQDKLPTASKSAMNSQNLGEGFTVACSQFGNRYAAVGLRLIASIIFCVLFSKAQAQSPANVGTVAKANLNYIDTTTYNFDNFENKSFNVSVGYRYFYDLVNYKHTLKVHPKADLVRFPLISYSLDFAATPKVALYEEIPAFMKKTPFRYVDSKGDTKEGTLEQFSENKLLVLDFWATWCAPCVASMDKWNVIVKEIPEVEVLGVMLDFDYKALFYGMDRNWSSPIVFGPQAYLLNSFFFERPVVSRMAWIKDGHLIAFTGTKDYDLQLVRDVLAGKEVDIPMNLESTYSPKLR